MRAKNITWLSGCAAILLATSSSAAFLDLFRPVEVAAGTWLLAPTIPGEARVGVVIGSRSVALIGAPKSGVYARQIVEHVRELTDKPISHVIVPSQFCDHACGSAELSGIATIVASDTFDPRLIRWKSTLDEGPEYYLDAGIATPNVQVSASMDIDLGGRTVSIRKGASAIDPAALVVLQDDVHVAWTGVAGDCVPGYRIVQGYDPGS